MKRKIKGSIGTHFEKRARQSSHARASRAPCAPISESDPDDFDYGAFWDRHGPLDQVFQKSSSDSTQSWSQTPVSRSEKWIQIKMAVQMHASIQERNQEEVTALAHHKTQVCAVGDHLLHHKPPFCAVSDHVLLESRDEQVATTPEPTQHELSILQNENRYAMLMEERLSHIANNYTDQDLSRDPRYQEISLDEPISVPL